MSQLLFVDANTKYAISYVHGWSANMLAFSYKEYINSLRPRQNRRHFADDVFKCNFVNENVWIPIKISLKFIPKVPVNNIPTLVQVMAWRRPGIIWINDG